MISPFPQKSPVSRQVLGMSAVFCSTFCFYLATVIIRLAESEVEIESSYFVFGRFLLGFLVVSTTMIIRKQRFKPVKYHYLIGRTAANTVAVFCFYKAIETGSVAEANILNMTYPLFVALFSWFLIRKQRDTIALAIVGVAFAGIWMILSPADMALRGDNIWGLSSGITAAAAMIYLNISRRYHDSQTILLFMFGFGALGILLLFHHSIFFPDSREFLFLFACSAVGVAGQYLLTFGFLYVTAVEGSIISSSRILLAALLGPVLVSDPPLALSGWCGALLIFLANSALALRKSKVMAS
ncbi:MAG: DMT family transporter [Deltaproteobacteria bacterium]|nr:DMT family transporter [Deltaproteobacteria bacterium]